METDDDQPLTSVQQQPDGCSVALWPLYDVTAVLAHMSTLRTLTSLTCPVVSQSTDELRLCLKYECDVSLAQPLSLLPLTLINAAAADDNDVMRQLRDAAVLQCLARLTHRQSSLHDARRWLLWRPSRARDDGDDDVQAEQATTVSFGETGLVSRCKRPC